MPGLGGMQKLQKLRKTKKGALSVQRNRMTPWYIGIIIIVIVDAILLLLTDEGQAELAQQAALVAIPLVGLGLMYLMFKSQK